MEQANPQNCTPLLEQLMEEGTLDAPLLDRLLGAYTIFEYRDGKWFRKQASSSYLEILYRDEAAAQASWSQDILAAVIDEDREAVFRALEDGETARSRCHFRRILKDGSCIWLDLDTFLLKKRRAPPCTAAFCGT